MRRRAIFLDMDDVLADLCGKLLENGIDKEKDSDQDKIREYLRDNIDTVFLDLKPVTGCSALLSLYFQYPDVKILTSTPSAMDSDEIWRSVRAQKLDWLNRFIPGFNERDLHLVGWRQKALLYCKRGDILVDDSFDNISDWNKSEGIGLWYAPHLLSKNEHINNLSRQTVALIENLCK